MEEVREEKKGESEKAASSAACGEDAASSDGPARETREEEAEKIEGIPDREQKKEQQELFQNVFMGPVNIVQAGEMSGCDLQQGGSAPKEVRKNGENAPCVPPKNETEFIAYMEGHAHSLLLFVFITCVSLGVVEEGRLEELARRLREHMGLAPIETDEGKQEELLSDRMISHARLLQDAFLERCMVSRNSNAGEINICCVRPESTELMNRTREWIWFSYAQYRGAIVDWLLELSIEGRSFVSRQAADGLAGYAVLDEGYAYENLIPKLTHHAQLAQLSCLNQIVERLLKLERTRVSAETLLCNWMNLKNSHLFMVGLRLSVQRPALSCLQKFPGIFKGILSGSYYSGRGGRRRQWFALTCIMGFARESDKILIQIVQGISDGFAGCASFAQRKEWAGRFLTLLMADYVMEDAGTGCLLLVSGLNRPEIRKKLKPLFLFLWQTHALRKGLLEILDAYFEEAAERERPVEQTRRLFQILAFAGTAAYFEKTEAYLKKLERQPALAEFAKATQNWLWNTLESRES